MDILIDKYIMSLYQEMEDEVIADIARRVKKTGRYTETAELMAKSMHEQGFSPSKIQAEVMKMLRADKTYQMAVAENTKAYKQEIQDIIDETVKAAKEANDILVSEAGNMAWNNDLSMWEQHGEDLTKPNNMSQLISAARMQTMGALKNLTKTMGFRNTTLGTTGVLNAYQRELDLALIKVSTGVFSFDQAVNDCVHRLAQSGLRSIDYEGGRTYQIDTAVRMNIRTGMSQLAGKVMEANLESSGQDLVITSQHMGSRPEHAPWQNKVFSYSGKSKKYPDFFKETGYGTVEGLKGANCTHDFYPFWEGASVIPEDIVEPDPVTIDGKEYDYYQATQKQRQLERNIRAIKREIEAQNRLGGPTTELRSKLKAQTNEYTRFSRKAGLKVRDNRLRVEKGSSNLSKTHSNRKYHSIIETERADGYRIGNNIVNIDYINSVDYREKFNSFSPNQSLNEAIYETARKILMHRNGTDIEDMYLIHKSKATIEGAQLQCKKALEVEYNDSLINAVMTNKKHSLIAIHNHPTNILPDGSDYVSCGYRKYSEGVVVCHNGKVYCYKVGDRIFTSGVLDKRIDKYTKSPYNMSSEDAHIRVLDEMSKEYGLEWRELK